MLECTDMKKSTTLFLAVGVVVIAAILLLTRVFDKEKIDPTASPTDQPTNSISPLISPSVSGSVTPTPRKTALPTSPVSPTPTKSAGLVPSPVPWDQLPPEASCELNGEIKYVLVDSGPNHSNIYDNQNAKFIYRGIDHPGRLVNWTVSPQDDLRVGPQIFAQIPLPDGESLIGISLPENPKYKTYELTAAVSYGRLVDGNVKLFTKQCTGKTTVMLP